jgi:Domain of unknown function (DUF1707)
VVPVTAGPGDQGAADAAAGGYLRASHADREHVIALLKAAFVQGMLTEEELDARAGQTFASRTHGELAALTADLPAGLIAARPPGKTVPAQAKPSANKALLWGSWVVVLVTIGFMLGAFPASPMFALAVGVLPLLIAVPLAGSLTLDAWREKRSPGQLPPGPARSGQELEGERDSATGDDLILCKAHRDTPARRLPGPSLTQRVWRSVPT